MTSVSVRELRDRDFDGWRPLWDAYTAFYRARQSESASEATFRRLCAQEDGLFGLVAFTAERLVAIAHSVLHSNTWSGASSCYLQDLFVDPGSRGSGVAEQLIATVYAAAGKRGADRVYWHTQQFNAPARSLYDTVGRPTSFMVYEQEIG